MLSVQWHRLALRTIGAVRALLFPVLLAGVLTGCTQAFFLPDRVVIDTPDRHGMRYESLRVRAQDGTLLNAWFLPAHGTPRGTILYLHGTSQNLTAHFQRVAWLPEAGFNVFALDYRGYGESDGWPSVYGAELDIDAAMRALLSRRDVDPARIFVFGQSLGGALAIYYVAHSAYRAHVRAVIIDSAFADYRLIAREKMPALFPARPADWLARLVDDDYSPRGAVAALSPIPLLLIHGERDTIIGPHHSKLLFEKAEQPKDFWPVPGAGHIEAIGSPLVRERLTNFLLSHAG
jgi:fermentation-respiration switch protein FrsA (DUF1100 family)